MTTDAAPALATAAEPVSLRERLDRALRERDEYQDQVHALTERVRNMTNAASNAAATATAAIGRLEVAEEVAKAAEKFIDDPKSLNAIFALHEKVLAWQARKPS